MQKQQRLIIENVRPLVNNGEFPIKRVINDIVPVEAAIYADGHDVLQASIHFKAANEKEFSEVRLSDVGNDEFQGQFQVNQMGYYSYFIEAWVDHALTWQKGIKSKIEHQIMVKSELLEGVLYLDYLKKFLANDHDKDFVHQAKLLFEAQDAYQEACQVACSDHLQHLFLTYPYRKYATKSPTFEVDVDRKKAEFSTWYEFFPRSASKEEGKHGSFKDCEELLPRVADMGFDVLYFPPIHPIGEVNRKGKNNATTALEGDTGVPWGIGSKHGGHKSIHPELGTEDDFLRLVNKAESLGIEIAMDLAFQAAPDHPYLKNHPEWFKFRPDGTIQYAENPPKKYQDIVNFNFECKEAKALWEELLSVGKYWAKRGIKVFRVDNPHTKSFRFWNYFIKEIKLEYPETIFLSEAFSRPKIMQGLAKQGFNQSYTYFTWRTSKDELIGYMNELTKSEQREYFRPNFWPNTPDINPYHLQGANEAMHILRYALAATLSSNIGVYGPVFEYMVSDAIPGKEEYMDSEKYQLRHWDWNNENKLIHIIRKINHIRKSLEALQQTNLIEFCSIENHQLLGFVKQSKDGNQKVCCVISLDPYYSQKGMLRLPFEQIGIQAGSELKVHDHLTNNTYTWREEWNYVELHPALPVHIFEIH